MVVKWGFKSNTFEGLRIRPKNKKGPLLTHLARCPIMEIRGSAAKTGLVYIGRFEPGNKILMNTNGHQNTHEKIVPLRPIYMIFGKHNI